jgi:anthranilate phosphoribosyltransferase
MRLIDKLFGSIQVGAELVLISHKGDHRQDITPATKEAHRAAEAGEKAPDVSPTPGRGGKSQRAASLSP